MFWPLHDRKECERVFTSRFHRPPPWYELVSASSDDAMAVATALSMRLSIVPPTANLVRVLSAAWKRLEPDSKPDRRIHVDPTGQTEPLDLATKRLGVPTTRAVWLVRDPGINCLAKLRCRDVIEFASVLWQDDSWMIDEDARWILAGMHERCASWIRFSR